MLSSAETTSFGRYNDQEVFLVTLCAGDLSVAVCTYGGIVQSVRFKGKELTLGYDTLAEYATDRATYFGATVGRVANRIRNGTFALDGEVHTLETNNGANHLHGGKGGWSFRVWDHAVSQIDGESCVTLTYKAEDGEDGYPGGALATVQYALAVVEEAGCTPQVCLVMRSHVVATNKPTIVNIVNHNYWNLEGYTQAPSEATPSVLDHQLSVSADFYVPVDTASLIPTGEIRSVSGTPLDFTSTRRIGDRVNDSSLGASPGGYDHCFVLTAPQHAAAVPFLAGWHGLVRPCAELRAPVSGTRLRISTTQPAVQVYTGNFTHAGKGHMGAPFGFRSAVCLETEHFPDSANIPHFPSTVIRPNGPPYEHVTVFRFD
jgi:aldose 1-epimerase